MCSMCACLLYGGDQAYGGIPNKKVGPPLNRHGVRLRTADGSPATDQQPPALLRYSPALFAKEAPEVFEHDVDTNRLSLKPGQTPPWLRPNPPRGDANTWFGATYKN